MNQQLSDALTGRIVIEQAKGMLAERQGLDMQEAFETLRHYARNHNLRLAELAQSVVDKTIVASALTPRPVRQARSRFATKSNSRRRWVRHRDRQACCNPDPRPSFLLGRWLEEQSPRVCRNGTAEWHFTVPGWSITGAGVVSLPVAQPA